MRSRGENLVSDDASPFPPFIQFAKGGANLCLNQAFAIEMYNLLRKGNIHDVKILACKPLNCLYMPLLFVPALLRLYEKNRYNYYPERADFKQVA